MIKKPNQGNTKPYAKIKDNTIIEDLMECGQRARNFFDQSFGNDFFFGHENQLIFDGRTSTIEHKNFHTISVRILRGEVRQPF